MLTNFVRIETRKRPGAKNCHENCSARGRGSELYRQEVSLVGVVQVYVRTVKIHATEC